MRIPQIDLKAGYLAQKQQIDEAIQRVLESGRFLLGQELLGLEREFAEWIGTSHVIGVANGTDALSISLMAAGVGRGDAVFTVAHTAVATVEAIIRCGATPVLVDVDAERFTLDPHLLEVALKDTSKLAGARPKAVIPVHLYGQPVDIDSIAGIAAEHGLILIEDCAQAAGATVGGRKVGTFGDFGAFSFYPTKNLGAFGDAGLIVTNSAGHAERVRRIREYGWDEMRVSREIGMNSRLDELQAAILRIKLQTLDRDNTERRRIADRYSIRLAASELRLPSIAQGTQHAFHQYVVRHAKRDDLRAFLETRGIGSSIHYELPVHMHPYFSPRVICASSMNVSEQLARQVLSLPMFPQLSAEAVEVISAACLEWRP